MKNRFAFFKGCFASIRLPHLEHISRIVLGDLGIDLVDLNDFTCCPEPITFGLSDKITWLSIAARNLCLAEEKGLDVLTICNGCTYTLKQANLALKENIELRGKINKILSPTGHEFNGTVEVRHFMEVLKEDVGTEGVRKRVQSPLSGLSVATHTGCHILSPSDIMKFDDPYDPTVLDNFVTALGATPVDYDLKPLCCGWTLSYFGSKNSVVELLSDKLQNIREAKADCIAVICPQCFYQLDMGQALIAQKLGWIPVLFYPQLLGLALGYNMDEILYKAHTAKDAGFENKVKMITEWAKW